MMRITKRQLRRIIREEKSRLLAEQPGSYKPGESALTDIAAQIEDVMRNYVGQVDLDFSDDPLTYENILDFVVRMLHEQR